MRGTNCPTCGPDVKIDDDGCCVHCGQDALDPTLPFDDEARGWVGVPHAKTETSKTEAEKMASRVGALRQRCYEHVHKQGAHGATPFETAAALAVPTNSAGPRFPELRKAGKLVKVNEKRKTYNGGFSRVHVALEPPWEVAE